MITRSPAFNVLFASAGRRVELLHAFRRAYESLGLKGNIVAIDIDPLAPALHAADVSYLVPRLHDRGYVETLAQICRKEAINLVFPLIDPDIPVLAFYRKELERTGARVAVIPFESVDIVGDKWKTYHFFKELGLPTPASWLPGDEALAAQSFPLFIKPRRGSASQQTFTVRNKKELEFFSEYVPEAIVQEFLPGPEITTDLVCDLDYKVLAVVSRQRIEVRSGEVSKGVTVHHPFIEAACRKIADALPAIGPITVQCLLKDQNPHFTEINARIGGGFPLGVRAGADSPRLLLARLAAVPFTANDADQYVDGLYFTRFDESFVLNRAQYDQITRRRL